MNFLRRPTTLLPSDAMRFQAMADNAPVGSVGASGGLLAPRPVKKSNALSGLLAAGSMVPGVGDAVGLLGDAAMYASDPSSRTWPNALMTGLGALPFVPSAQQLAELAGPLSAMVVYHGSPHKFDAFDMSKIGTGEGAQAYGHGLYLAENPEVAKEYMKVSPSVIPPTRRAFMGKELDAGTWEYKAASLVDEMGLARARQLVSGWLKSARPGEDVAGYQKTLETLNAASSRKDFAKLKNQSNLYTVDLPDEAIAKMLDWDKPLSEQAPEVRAALEAAGIDGSNPYQTGEELYREMQNVGSVAGHASYKGGGISSGIEAVTNWLRQQGIPGIRYLDGGSRSGGKGTSNFVVFDDKLPKILKRE